MSITVNPDVSGRVSELIYEYKDVKITIEVFVFFVTKWNDCTNLGFVLEKYRQLLDDEGVQSANKFFEGHQKLFNKFISSISYPFGCFTPDYVNIFFPVDINRLSFLRNFSDVLLKGISDIKKVDFSANFRKMNPSLSVTKNINESEFDLIIASDLNKIDRLLMIDDTIDKGRTVEKLLNKLADKELLIESTKVKLICAYNNAKSKRVDVHEFLGK